MLLAWGCPTSGGGVLAVNWGGMLLSGLFRSGMRRIWALRQCASEAGFPGKRWLVSGAWVTRLRRCPTVFLVSRPHFLTFKILGHIYLCVQVPYGCRRATWELALATVWVPGIEPELSGQQVPYLLSHLAELFVSFSTSLDR